MIIHFSITIRCRQEGTTRQSVYYNDHGSNATSFTWMTNEGKTFLAGRDYDKITENKLYFNILYDIF
jgi:hypothetical protein